MFKCDCKCKLGYDISELIICSVCNFKYSYQCVNINEVNFRKLSKRSYKNWKCSSCKCEASSTMAKLTDEFKKELLNEVKNIIIDELKEIKNEIKSNNRNVNDLRKALDSFSDRLDDWNKKIDIFQRDYSEIKKENDFLNKKIYDLEKQVIELQQYSRCNNLEIHGFPVSKNENVFDILAATAESLGISDTKSMINAAHRLPSKNKLSPPIIVSFTARTAKEKWLGEYKKYIKENKTLLTTHVNKNLKKAPIYFNHHLSPYYKNLLYESKKFVKENNFKYCWVANGKVYIRRQEGERAVRIATMLDLDSLQQKLASN